MHSIKPEVKSVIEKNANKLLGRKVNVDSLVKELHKEALLKGRNEKDLQAIGVLILVQVSRNADNELKNLVVHMRQANSSSADESENYKNAASELVENKSEVAENVTFLLKRISGSSEMVMDKFK